MPSHHVVNSNQLTASWSDEGWRCDLKSSTRLTTTTSTAAVLIITTAAAVSCYQM
jgi:hypothetical protein